MTLIDLRLQPHPELLNDLIEIHGEVEGKRRFDEDVGHSPTLTVAIEHIAGIVSRDPQEGVDIELLSGEHVYRVVETKAQVLALIRNASPTVVSENLLDLVQTLVGPGAPVQLVFQVDTAGGFHVALTTPSSAIGNVRAWDNESVSAAVGYLLDLEVLKPVP